jgi:hypothetical protein
MFASGRLFCFRGKIDPELDHPERPPRLAYFRAMKLLMDKSGCRHPLHIARTNAAAAA